MQKRVLKRTKKRLVRYGLIFGNLVLVAAAVGFILRHPSGITIKQDSSIFNNKANSTVSGPLDQISAADIAVHIATAANLPEIDAVTNNADTVNTKLAVIPVNTAVVAKPQIVSTRTITKNDIMLYKVQKGETIGSVAKKFDISSNSIRWSNALSGDELTEGMKLWLPPQGVNGIVYTVKRGDTLGGIVERFKANRAQFIQANDAEISGIKPGQRVLIPNGTVTQVQNQVFFSPTFGGNGYIFGYCTWWTANRRAAVGKPIPTNLGNASTWKDRSILAGMSVGRAPKVHAVIWTPPRDWYGHVAFVESIDAKGNVHISEMNVFGWNKVSYNTLTPEQASRYYYIY